MKYLMFSILAVFSVVTSTAAVPPVVGKNKFKDPIAKFDGMWRVDSYDFRKFIEKPADFDEQARNSPAVFPIGPRIHFSRAGLVQMPGYDAVSQSLIGPINDSVLMKIAPPFDAKLCASFWSFMCEGKKEIYKKQLMIAGIDKWNSDYDNAWPDVVPVTYTFVHLGRFYDFSVWIAKNGDLMFIALLEGRTKSGDESDFFAIRLKRIGD